MLEFLWKVCGLVRYDSDTRSTNHLMFIPKFPWKRSSSFPEPCVPIVKCLELVETVISSKRQSFPSPKLTSYNIHSLHGQSLVASNGFFLLVDEVDGSIFVANFCMDMRY